MASWAVLNKTKKKCDFVLNLCDHTHMWEKNLVKKTGKTPVDGSGKSKSEDAVSG